MANPGERSELPIDEATAFSNKKGEIKERIKRKQLEMLAPYEVLLKQFLEPGEKVLLAMHGCSPMSSLEQLTMGWTAAYLKRCTFVLTDRRILHFPSKSDYGPRNSIAQMRFGDLEEIKTSSLFGKFTVVYKGGNKESFNYVKDAAKFKSVLPALQFKGQPATRAGSRHHLCPRCTAPLAGGLYTCTGCSLEFKNEERARKLSLLIPGGGYFYTNHPWIGVQDFVVETILILLVVTSAFAAIGDPAESMGGLVVFGFALALEKFYTVYHARQYVREFIPVDLNYQPRRQ